VSGIDAAPTLFTMSGDDVSRGNPANADDGRSKVLPSTALDIALNEPRSEKSSGRSWENTTMNSAAVSPMFSM